MLLNRNVLVRSTISALALTTSLWFTAALASAQTAAQPSAAPGGDGSPLGPYLFTFILAGGGIIVAIAVNLTDKLMKVDHDGWAANGSRRVLGITVIGDRS